MALIPPDASINTTVHRSYHTVIKCFNEFAFSSVAVFEGIHPVTVGMQYSRIGGRITGITLRQRISSRL
jgi:hypothetical protein